MERPQVLSYAFFSNLPYHYERGVAQSRRQEGERGWAGDLEGEREGVCVVASLHVAG